MTKIQVTYGGTYAKLLRPRIVRDPVKEAERMPKDVYGNPRHEIVATIDVPEKLVWDVLANVIRYARQFDTKLPGEVTDTVRKNLETYLGRFEKNLN